MIWFGAVLLGSIWGFVGDESDDNIHNQRTETTEGSIEVLKWE